ncbi:MAG: hypothetical protein VR65_09175 [Desulfobulbaceae bacterium BRH_c16a]|nr:MAG: hypothetical protein VR65_09175 [Desulfobulbaceae bacterium BRH_c16a]
MKDDTKQTLQEDIYQPANRFMQTVYEKPFAPLAAMATFGIGLAFLLSDNKHRHSHPAKEEPLREQPSAVDNKYFEAAPRSVQGSHPGFRHSTDTGNVGAMKKSGQVLIGSAALLSIFYLVGKKKTPIQGEH